MLLKKQKTIKMILVLVLLSLPSLAMARGLVPCGGDGEKPCTVSDTFILVARTTNWLIAAAGIYAVYQIVNAGFGMVISMGNEEALTKKKSALTSAVVGFGMVMFAFVFINLAVNGLMRKGMQVPSCQIDLKNPLTYLNIQNPDVACRADYNK